MSRVVLALTYTAMLDQNQEIILLYVFVNFPEDEVFLKRLSVEIQRNILNLQNEH